MFLQFLFFILFTCLKEIVYLWCSASVRNSVIHGECFIFSYSLLARTKSLTVAADCSDSVASSPFAIYIHCERVEWIKVSAFLFNKRMDGCIIRKNEEILSERVSEWEEILQSGCFSICSAFQLCRRIYLELIKRKYLNKIKFQCIGYLKCVQVINKILLFEKLARRVTLTVLWTRI